MSDLVRFGVAMDRALLGQFDRRIAALGYENRSEALRDLVRADLTRAAWTEGAVVVATMTVVYTPDVRAELFHVTEQGPGATNLLLSSIHVRIDAARCLDTLVLRGEAHALGSLAGRIAGMKGVLSCELSVAAVANQTPGQTSEANRT